MPKFKVYSSQLVYHVTEVEAQDEDQAQEIAFNDSDSWQWFDCGNWQIEDIQEVKL